MRKNLAGLPEPLRREREFQSKRVLDPGAGHIGDWTNRYSYSLFPFTAEILSRRILPSNPSRTYLFIQNKSASLMHVNFGTNATILGSINIIAGGNIELIGGAQGGVFCSPDDVYILGAAAGLPGVIGQGLWKSVVV